MSNIATYTNRDGDKITFTHEGEKVTMEGGHWLRWAYEDDGTITMVDPSGGPYIEVGDNLKMFWLKGEYQDLIIESIEVDTQTELDKSVNVIFKIK